MTWRLPRPFGLLAALFALVSQLALGAVIVPDDPAPALAAATILCATDAPTPGKAPTPHHHAADTAICPLAVALAQPALLPESTPAFFPPRPLLVIRARTQPPGRGPPPRTARVGAPRAPPFLA